MKKYLCLIALSTLLSATITQSDLPRLKVVNSTALNPIERIKFAFQGFVACKNLNESDKKNIGQGDNCLHFDPTFEYFSHLNFLYLLRNNEVVGVATVHPSSCSLLHFFVAQAARGSGAADIFMRGVFENLYQCPHITVYAAEKATSFYKRNGFQYGSNGKPRAYGPLMTAQNPSYSPQK